MGGGAAAVARVATVGLGGVGKTQVAMEYCYRHYEAGTGGGGGDLYGLVVWLPAENAQALAAALRRLAVDAGMLGDDPAAAVAAAAARRDGEIAALVRARLLRTRCPWLVVFDNVEPGPRGAALLGAHLPSGAHGHVLELLMLPAKYGDPSVLGLVFF